MIKNKKMKLMLWYVALLLLIFQALVVIVALPRGYYLIYDWVFYVINYTIVMIFFLLYTNNRVTRYLQWIVALILFVANTTFFYYMKDVNVIVSKPESKHHEVIIKEYSNLNFETVRLKRRGLLFGKKIDTLMGSSTYKTVKEDTYKIDWISGDIATLIYQAGNNGVLDQQIFSFRPSNHGSYRYVIPSLTGKWLEQENHDNYFMVDSTDIIYATEGKLYYYNVNDTEQYGIFSIMVQGDESKPSFSVVINADSEFDENGLIKDDGTITIIPLSLEKGKGKVYSKE